ncbi:uncharacterized protein SETTUDRAFT_19923 [Exserohilum turcica Et28A]|uniref:Uncharacterized protein n=1 Tax=Exserohilum turcicum (strain 28A) TaxID=671987 RepID=R0IR79_EXST2|nr:uncharacterized protein SETTUDRAFT_19923 [Exserohilum turcica Et28A]EOA87400.1 hypothetical protein SETTUDRAFT_19923 [Exserohilum turcica Et28A]
MLPIIVVYRAYGIKDILLMLQHPMPQSKLWFKEAATLHAFQVKARRPAPSPRKIPPKIANIQKSKWWTNVSKKTKAGKQDARLLKAPAESAEVEKSGASDSIQPKANEKENATQKTLSSEADDDLRKHALRKLWRLILTHIFFPQYLHQYPSH